MWADLIVETNYLLPSREIISEYEGVPSNIFDTTVVFSQKIYAWKELFD